ncbi:hypothetical protein HJD18_10315 [Thermoleophilia bacterium SCSIO 60948]|nr:hypothetical protein HJD18_10315 [Thermoleophilia bacterium SCSIO 60948]
MTDSTEKPSEAGPGPIHTPRQSPEAPPAAEAGDAGTHTTPTGGAPRNEEPGGGAKAARAAASAAERVGATVERGLVAGWRELADRRGLRTALVGATLLIAALILGGDSALTVPFLVLGIVLLILGVMGPRLSGHFSVEFGSDGTRIDLRTDIAAPGTTAPSIRGELREAERDIERLSERVSDAEVVEGQGETIEIDVSELRSLMAAAESKGEPGSRTSPTSLADRRAG